MYVLNCRNVVPLAYNSPPACPQSASTALPMEYGQGLCQIVDAVASWQSVTLLV